MAAHVLVRLCAVLSLLTAPAAAQSNAPPPREVHSITNRRLVTDIIKNITSESEALPGDPLKFPPKHTPPLKVYVSAVLYHVVDVNWVDEKLVWAPEDYNGATTAYVPGSRVWIPELYLYHSVAGSTPLYMDDSAVQVNSSGGIRAFVPFTARAFCPIDVRHFPFDEQVCQFKFGSWSYLSSSLIYIMETNTIFLEDFYDNQEWLLTHSEVASDSLPYDTGQYNESYSMIVMTLRLKRQSFYYVFNLVIPVTLVSIVTVLGFHTRMTTDGRRVQKFRLGIMALLSMGVSLLMVVNDMPKFALESIPGQRGSFSAVPLLGLLYIGLITVISSSTCFVQVFIGLEGYALKHPDVTSIPRCLRWLVRDCPCCRHRLINTTTKNKHKYGGEVATTTTGTAAELLAPPCKTSVDAVDRPLQMCPTPLSTTKLRSGSSPSGQNSSFDMSPVLNRLNPGQQQPVERQILAALRRTIEELADTMQATASDIHSATPKQMRPHWIMLLNRLENCSLTFFVSLIVLLLIGFFAGPGLYTR